MAKKKIVKLNDEQYYKYIMSLKNGSVIKNTDGDTQAPESPKNDGKKRNSENRKKAQTFPREKSRSVRRRNRQT